MLAFDIILHIKHSAFRKRDITQRKMFEIPQLSHQFVNAQDNMETFDILSPRAANLKLLLAKWIYS